MTKLLRVCVVFLLFRIDWRKLFVVCSILTIVSVLIQIYSLPYPLTEWISPPHLAISSYKPLNTAVHLGKSHSLAVGVQLESVRSAPAVVSLSSSAILNKSMGISNKAKKASRRRRRSSSVNSIRLSPPSSPHTVKNLPSRLEVIWLLLLLLYVSNFSCYISYLNRFFLLFIEVPLVIDTR